MNEYKTKIERDYEKALGEFTTKKSAIENAFQIALYQEIKETLLNVVSYNGEMLLENSFLKENTIKAIKNCKENIFIKIYYETLNCSTREYNWFYYKDLECFINEVFE